MDLSSATGDCVVAVEAVYRRPRPVSGEQLTREAVRCAGVAHDLQLMEYEGCTLCSLGPDVCDLELARVRRHHRVHGPISAAELLHVLVGPVRRRGRESDRAALRGRCCRCGRRGRRAAGRRLPGLAAGLASGGFLALCGLLALCALLPALAALARILAGRFRLLEPGLHGALAVPHSLRRRPAAGSRPTGGGCGGCACGCRPGRGGSTRPRCGRGARRPQELGDEALVLGHGVVLAQELGE
mmetsp:Transcript_35468/g.106002  ORF Transcript_35468/g.106002 Transcript_35468/m.106002 type:complete len:242 (+) Transcript_35468:452-1177(+)